MENLIESLSAAARQVPESGIVAIANRAWGKTDVIRLLAGESDLQTPSFISDATVASLKGGETFYTWQRGIPELREALSRYHARHFGVDLHSDRFVVTGGGMQAIQLAAQSIGNPGDEIIYLAPAWPNIPASVTIAAKKAVPVDLLEAGGGWSLDVAVLEAAVTPRTRAIFVNSPSNPTGWTASLDDLSAILRIAREHGLWIVADEVYALFSYGPGRAPSFFDIATSEDRIIYVNTFSKNWAMTGWRIGWMTIPPGLSGVYENLVQYSTSGVAQFMQRGAIAALDHGDEFVRDQTGRAKQSLEIVVEALSSTNRVSCAKPAGAFYLFFSVDGISNSHETALRLVDEAGVALAPGTAFGERGEGYFRLCFNRDPKQVKVAAERLAGWIRAN